MILNVQKRLYLIRTFVVIVFFGVFSLSRMNTRVLVPFSNYLLVLFQFRPRFLFDKPITLSIFKCCVHISSLLGL